jgi:fluoride exporter
MFPVATFLVNVVGTVILGAVAALPTGWLPSHDLVKPAIGTGFCGGLTTFSTMSLEIYRLFPGRPEIAAGYIAASLLAAPLCALAGAILGLRIKAMAPGRVSEPEPAPPAQAPPARARSERR